MPSPAYKNTGHSLREGGREGERERGGERDLKASKNKKEDPKTLVGGDISTKTIFEDNSADDTSYA